MYLNIEKRDIDFVEETYAQPNVIRLKPSSKANILANRLNVPVSNIAEVSIVEEQDKVELDATTVAEKKEIGKIVVAETATADLFIFDQNSEMTNIGSKPINLSAKMFENVAKKHDSYMRKINGEIVNKESESSDYGMIKEIENDEINNVFDAIDNVINDNDIEINNTVHEEIEDEFAELNNTTNKFIELVNDETKTEKDLSVSKEQFKKVSRELEEANEIEKNEIVRKYELEEAIKIETKRQREILEKQSEIVNSRIAELKTEKADIDMQVEKKNVELDNTNMNIGIIKSENNDLASIYEAIINSYENRSEDPTQDISVRKTA